MTYEEFWLSVLTDHSKSKEDGLRLGQRYINRLAESHSHLMHYLVGSEYDCFYKAVVPQKTHEWVHRNW